MPSLSDITAGYDAFIVDLWGVIHDGVELYPGVLSALEHLQQAGKPVLFLSNAPRPARHVDATMKALGVGRGLYQEIVTSGEVARAFLALPETQARYGLKCLYPGIEIEANILEGLPQLRVETVEEAEFILAAGYDYFGQPLSEMQPRLERALARQLPMLCINPDIEVVRLDGSRMFCAGHFAAWYAAQGGAVEYIGKPHKRVYDYCFARLAAYDKAAILAVGDNMATDIPGGKQAGLDTLLVTSGVNEHWEQAGEVTPTYILPGFNLEATE